MDIVLGKYIIKDWSIEYFHRFQSYSPLEYYHVRNILIISETITKINCIISLRNPWGYYGITDPNTWILFFDGGDFKNIHTKMYNEHPIYFKTFTDLESGKNHVDDFLNKFSKLKAFI
jgi:hypothetical protein